MSVRFVRISEPPPAKSLSDPSVEHFSEQKFSTKNRRHLDRRSQLVLVPLWSKFMYVVWGASPLRNQELETSISLTALHTELCVVIESSYGVPDSFRSR